MNEKIIACIPSKAMRKFLTANPIKMSVLQQATIISEYAEKKERVPLFQILLGETTNEAEKLLISSAIEDRTVMIFIVIKRWRFIIKISHIMLFRCIRF